MTTQKLDSVSIRRPIRHSAKKWLVRTILLVLFLLVITIALLLNPGLFYKHKTTLGQFTVYHADTLDVSFPRRLQEAFKLLRKSEVSNAAFRMDICLGSSAYTSIVKRFFGDGFAWGFYNKVVIDGRFDSKRNLHETSWNFSQLLAHEMTHCLQFDKLGLFHSNPVAGYPPWKWEGFAE